MDVASKADAIETRIGTSPWADHEHVRGYAVLEMPFSSGDLLGLRVWPQSDFAPWTSVWHRTPEGAWSIHNDGHSIETTCPRYWNPVLENATLADIDVSWTGPTELRVEMDDPQLEWTMSMGAPRSLRALNAASAALPLWSWKPATLLRTREWIAKHVLGMGDVSFSFAGPRGHDVTIMPQEVFFVEESTAVLDGRSLGDPVRLETNPTIGDVPTPARPVFVFGQAHLGIVDLEEYHRTRDRIRAASFEDSGQPRGRT